MTNFQGVATEVLPVDAQHPGPEAIERAAAIIRAGGLVAFPTETVYGLGGNALDAAAVRRIFAAKERAPSDPLIVHIADAADLSRIAREVPGAAMALARQFWPGPLTLVLPKQAAVPPEATAGLDTVAVRLPSHPVALALIRAAGTPIAAPSANRFTRTSATTAAHVLEDLDGRIELVLDGGPAIVGVESTVVAVDAAGVHVLRPGAVSLEALRATLREAGHDIPVEVARPQAAPASPGMLEKHYAPRARLCYVRGPREDALARLRKELDAAAGQQAGLLLPDDDLAALGDVVSATTVASLGPSDDLEAVAHRLYAGLRALDAAGVEVIFARQLTGDGLARAIDDRLRRAATTVIEVAE
ncbi:MAG: L-threonylcarbamoyladenylate synthase [Dehalococcoidia bacterium]|nr:L-threonylcarbamoyladenylate synthase [Dehalococcoidia bacterium]